MWRTCGKCWREAPKVVLDGTIAAKDAMFPANLGYSECFMHWVDENPTPVSRNYNLGALG